MKKIFASLVVVATIVLLGSCANTKNVAYFQNINDVNLAASQGLYDAKIMPKDELTITVNASDPAAARSFNLTRNGSDNSTGSSDPLPYLVDNEGNIMFPHLGKIHVAGMTKTQLQDYIIERTAQYFSKEEHPIVTVKMNNYRVTVMGEVASPSVVTVSSEKMSILEALASAGDLTIHGKRDNVLLIREDATGAKSSHYINLNDANLINSPYYYVQQNDVIYVTPNKTKASNADIGPSTNLWFSIIGLLFSTGSIIINLVK